MVAGLLDTSLVVRYLTDDPREMADRAARVIDGEATVAISPVVVVESAHVLSKVYGVARQEVVDLLVNLLLKENVVAIGPNKELLVEALLMCRLSARVSFADAAIWAEARSNGLDRVYTFDRRFPSHGLTLDSLEP